MNSDDSDEPFLTNNYSLLRKDDFLRIGGKPFRENRPLNHDLRTNSKTKTVSWFETTNSNENMRRQVSARHV